MTRPLHYYTVRKLVREWRETTVAAFDEEEAIELSSYDHHWTAIDTDTVDIEAEYDRKA